MSNETEQDAEAIHLAECTKEIDDAHATINKNQEEYDKQLLALSSGFLALSLAFIKDVVPTAQAICRGLLYSSFILLTLCVLSVLASYQLSIGGLFKHKAYWEEEKAKGKGTAKYPYAYAKLISWWNIGSGLFFVIGIALIMSFVLINLHQEAKVSALNSGTKDGAYLKAPSPAENVERGANMKTPPPPPRPSPPAAPTSKK